MERRALEYINNLFKNAIRQSNLSEENKKKAEIDFAYMLDEYMRGPVCNKDKIYRNMEAFCDSIKQQST
jgi:hypothetical protein